MAYGRRLEYSNYETEHLAIGQGKGGVLLEQKPLPMCSLSHSWKITPPPEIIIMIMFSFEGTFPSCLSV